MGVVGIEDKLEEEKTDKLETGKLEEKTGKLETGKREEKTDDLGEKNIYEKIQNIIHNYKVVAEYKYDINVDKRIYTYSEPIPIPK
jgi:hypothetical protein